MGEQVKKRITEPSSAAAIASMLFALASQSHNEISQVIFNLGGVVSAIASFVIPEIRKK